MKKLFFTIMIMPIILLAGCGTGISTETVTTTEGITEETVSAEPVAQEKALTEMNEAELREYLKNADNTEKEQCYEELFSLDAVTENDYYAYAEVLNTLGKHSEAKAALWDMYILFPSEESMKKLEDHENELESNPFELSRCADPDDFITYLNEFSESSEYKEDLCYDSNAFTCHSFYKDTNVEIEILTEEDPMEILIREESGSALKYINDNGNIICAGKSLVEGKENIKEVFISDTGERRAFEATFENGILVNELTLYLGDTIYFGRFDEYGKAQAEQIKSLDGVVYAYDESGKKYLYEKGGNIDEFKITEEYLGVIDFEMEY